MGSSKQKALTVDPPPIKYGLLRSYFSGIAVKRLRAVEADRGKSNQHELDGVQELRKILGEGRQERMPTKFIYLGNNEEDAATQDGFLTWYDAREAHPARSEYRLYFSPNVASEKAAEGDLVFVARRQDGTATLVITEQGSSPEAQLLWLFGLDRPDGEGGLNLRESGDERPLGLIRSMVLETLGIAAEPEADANYVPVILERFGGQFPTTQEFSAFARETLKEVSPTDDPDGALMAWTEREEALFKALERHIVAERLKAGFGPSGEDVDGFLEFSLSVHNRRKSRVGYAIENHLEHVFQTHRVSYSRGKVTEGNSKPDFVFPGIEQYRDSGFPDARLSMLAVKSTCKDRWRQILAEANRIRGKHLFTLEPAISKNQTEEMRSRLVRLVIPAAIHPTFSAEQRGQLLSLRGFLEHLQTEIPQDRKA